MRQEIDDRFPAAARGGGDSFDWMQLFDELRHRLATAGVAERSGEGDEFGLDVLTLLRTQALLDFLVDLLGASPTPADLAASLSRFHRRDV